MYFLVSLLPTTRAAPPPTIFILRLPTTNMLEWQTLISGIRESFGNIRSRKAHVSPVKIREGSKRAPWSFSRMPKNLTSELGRTFCYARHWKTTHSPLKTPSKKKKKKPQVITANKNLKEHVFIKMESLFPQIFDTHTFAFLKEKRRRVQP